MSDIASPTRRSGFRTFLLGLGIIAAVVGVALFEVYRTRPIRRAMGAYTKLIAAVNRQDLDALRALCSRRYRADHPLVAASGGGVVGLPRALPHKNFRAWRENGAIRLCPGDRAGPVYQFVLEGDAWKFDGPVGLLRAAGDFVPQGWNEDVARPQPVGSHASLPARGGAD